MDTLVGTIKLQVEVEIPLEEGMDKHAWKTMHVWDREEWLVKRLNQALLHGDFPLPFKMKTYQLKVASK